MREIILDIETTGISPIASIITALGLYNKEPEVHFGEEVELILLAKDTLMRNRTKVIGWRIRDYDIPFMNIRALKYDINFYIPRNRIVDLAEYFTVPVRIHSSQLADFLNIPYTSTPSSNMPLAYLTKNYKKIEEHCKADLIMIKQLYDRLKKVWGI